MNHKHLPLQILAAMLLGALVGKLLGPSAAPLGEIGKVVIQLIKALATPLLCLAIVDAFLKTQMSTKTGARFLFIALTNVTIALVIALALSNLFHAGEHFHGLVTAAAESLSAKQSGFFSNFSGFLPILAVLSGVALRRVKTRQKANSRFEWIESFIERSFAAVQKALGWVIRLMPFAVFGVLAKTIGEYGFKAIPGLFSYLTLVLAGLALQIFIVYQAWIHFYVRMKLGVFWRHAKDAVVYALGASSSLATLPVTLDTLDEMGVSKRASRMAACIGTNLNNDGIILYEALAVIFVAQAHGIHLTFTEQCLAALSCLIAGIGITGIPDAGLISLALVLGTLKLPTELLPLLLTVDWILSRARAVTNVVSDLAVSVTLDKMEKSK